MGARIPSPHPCCPTHTTTPIRFTPHQWSTTQWRVADTYMTLGRMAVEAAVATLMTAFARSTAAARLFACPWSHCTGPYLRRWVSDWCTKQDRQPEYPPSHRLGPKLCRTRLPLGQPAPPSEALAGAPAEQRIRTKR